MEVVRSEGLAIENWQMLHLRMLGIVGRVAI